MTCVRFVADAMRLPASTRWMTSRRLGYFLCVVGFLWGVTLMNMTLVNYTAKENQHQLKVRARLGAPYSPIEKAPLSVLIDRKKGKGVFVQGMT